MRSSQPVDESLKAESQTEVQPDQSVGGPDEPSFAPRVVLGTMIGVFSCLLLAALLMLMFWLPSIAGGGSANADGGTGDGRGLRVGDGK
jgi:hypothetical protein